MTTAAATPTPHDDQSHRPADPSNADTDATPGSIGTPLSPGATRAMLLGSGELGKEVVIELQRLGIETVAVDRYENAPAHQVAHRAHVVDMQDPVALRAVLDSERPDVVIPEIEAIATSVLAEIEAEQPWPVRIVPTARATVLTMDREGIRRLAAETLGLPTSPYRFVDSAAALREAVEQLGLPAVIKPVMSSSGHGQSVLRSLDDVAPAWRSAQTGSRGHAADGHAVRCIVEGFVDFDDEITQLTVRHTGGTTFLDPIHHLQVDGDYAESWQMSHSDHPDMPLSMPRSADETIPMPRSAAHIGNRPSHDDGVGLSETIVEKARDIARRITDALGGWGLFGVELFVKGDEVIFSEVSPRPHDTGLVTLVSQDLSEFALHTRAVLGLPVSEPERFPGAAASVPVKVAGSGVPVFHHVDAALAAAPTAQLRLFGKPRVDGERRVAVALARGASVAEARARAHAIADALVVELR
ncbi:formate-dependent phosphoribosylglycinamide formyltransferase [Pseudoclavibacter sp. 13-3]|uniref:formate-dependent phosphoribosylglycinamide formyltransferase n=1 Tax=Pseudoclavibacter sp. 13-3 TaxID=2901228 RepID=UPI001E4F01C8|nr:formate-dependent phosphoribosylglycinamide formyltransferase [Pseudoclavibacter sp. 13-3]MCD7101193.1 formate-dependent phosphoribosylglycinamide formyltransferase [Pseudoclavibacter sp. 13-3]